MRKFLFLTLAATLIPAFLFVLMGCMKTPEVKKDFGPEVAPSAIAEAKASAMSNSVLMMKVGEYASYNIDVKYENMSSITAYQIVEKISQRKEFPDYIHYVITRTNNKWEADKSSWKSWNDEYAVDVDKAPNLAKLLSVESPLRPRNSIFPEGQASDLLAQQMKAFDEASPSKITYHNLKKVAVSIPFPIEPMKRPDCGGVDKQKCGLPLRAWAISYDRVLHYEKTWEKQSWIYYISSDVPYLAGIVSACVSGTFVISDQLIGTLQCQGLTDFQYGQ